MENTTNRMNHFRNNLIQETLKLLLATNQHSFDLSTADGIENGINYYLDFHIQQSIESTDYANTKISDVKNLKDNEVN